jgi:hypothetical protein
MRYIKTPEGVLSTRHINAIIELEDGHAFAIVKHGPHGIELHGKHYAGWHLSADYETVCLLLEGHRDE